MPQSKTSLSTVASVSEANKTVFVVTCCEANT